MNKDISYYRAISNSLNCTNQQAEQYDAQSALLYDFDSNPSCKDVLLNGEQTKVIVYIDTDIITGGKSYKIVMKPNEVLKIGDILIIDDETWFVTKVEINKLISYSGTLAKSTCVLKFYKNGELKSLPCFITVGTRNYINERDNDFLRLPKSLYTAYCPDLGYLDKQDVNIRFFIKDYIYRAVGIDNLTVLEDEVRDGLIIMKLEDDKVSEDDNMELGIANYWSNQSAQPNKPSLDLIEGMTSYNIDIDFNKNYFLCGEQAKITSLVTNNDGNSISTDRLFYLSDENGNEINYVNIIETTNDTITIQVDKSGKYIGKKVKLRIIFPQLNNTTFEKMFTINSIV